MVMDSDTFGSRRARPLGRAQAGTDAGGDHSQRRLIDADFTAAAAQYRRGQILDATVAHAVANGLLAAYVLIFGHWAFW